MFSDQKSSSYFVRKLSVKCTLQKLISILFYNIFLFTYFQFNGEQVQVIDYFMVHCTWWLVLLLCMHTKNN